VIGVYSMSILSERGGTQAHNLGKLSMTNLGIEPIPLQKGNGRQMGNQDEY
jgi:hypothetical protein